MPELVIKNLKASIEKKEILKGVDLLIPSGEIHALMGPNGSGKTTLSEALMGKPGVRITSGTVSLDGKDILSMKPEERFRAGLFLAFQTPREIPGVNILSVLRLATSALSRARGEQAPSVSHLLGEISSAFTTLRLKEEMIQRPLNEGFSGGEKKKAEIAQLIVLKPLIAILDEPDSGLDVDSLKIIAEQLKMLVQKNNLGLLLITHSGKFLQYLEPDHVHIFSGGKIVKQGGPKLIKEIEEKGYSSYGQKT